MFSFPSADPAVLYAGMVSQEDYHVLSRIGIDGYSILELAKELGISQAACRKRIQRARERFRAQQDWLADGSLLNAEQTLVILKIIEEKKPLELNEGMEAATETAWHSFQTHYLPLVETDKNRLGLSSRINRCWSGIVFTRGDMISSKRTPLLLMSAGVLISFLLEPTPERLLLLAILLAISGMATLFRNKTQSALAVIVCCTLLFFFRVTIGVEFLKYNIRTGTTAEPEVHWSAPDAQVRLGGQELSFYENKDTALEHIFGKATACYWLDDSTALIAAHECPGLDEKATFPIRILSDEGEAAGLSAVILTNNYDGVTLRLTTDFLPTAALYPIAATDEIVVGEEAEIISFRGGSFPVLVKGFANLKYFKQQVIVVEPVSPTNAFIKGKSGSPIVQNGKIIGFFSMMPEKRLGLCRLAAEIYANTVKAMNECCYYHPIMSRN